MLSEEAERQRNDSSWSFWRKDGELFVLLLDSDSSMKKDVEVGRGEAARGSRGTNFKGGEMLKSRFLVFRQI
jgi:hypothetical protein